MMLVVALLHTLPLAAPLPGPAEELRALEAPSLLSRHPLFTSTPKQDALILSAVYGYDDCINVPYDTTMFPGVLNQSGFVPNAPNLLRPGIDDINALLTRGCNVHAVIDGEVQYELTTLDTFDAAGWAAGAVGYVTNAGPPPQLFLLLLNCPASPAWTDGAPMTFKYPVAGAPALLNPLDIKVTLNDGTVVNPACVMAAPAADNNEYQTYLMIGQFGDGQVGTQWPSMIEILGDIILQPPLPLAQPVSAKGSTFYFPEMSSYPNGLQMQQVNLQNVVNDTNDGNSCIGTHPDAGITHRIQVVYSGGPSKSDLLEPEIYETEFFEILLDDGSKMDSTTGYMGLADLGDGDNFFDLCLVLTGSLYDKIKEVRAPCELGRTDLYPPKGTYGEPCTPTTLTVDRNFDSCSTAMPNPPAGCSVSAV
mmetsp:Transcript_679/g.1549  ORF Transcript_679/g.1549 Transcript_679/m.1549 type:complete len:421 (-) Transcript_679:399-1661(-)